MEAINKLYETQTYFDIYNSSVFASLFLILVFFFLVSYFYIQQHIDPIKNNWAQQRCSPMVIPMAGFINKPKNMSNLDFTAQNFSFCVQNIIKDVATDAIKPINASQTLLASLFEGLEKSINETRGVFSSTRNAIGDISQNIMSRILNVLIPFQKMILHTKSMISKSHAVLVVGMNSVIASIITTLSALFNIHNLVKKFIVAAAATIAGMWLIPFVGFEMAAAASASLGITIALFGKVNKSLGIIENKSGVSPYCFKKGTLIRGLDNTLYAIECIPLGTKLMYGGSITAVFELSAESQIMYQLDNITVSGRHKVYYNKKWIYVENHPRAKQIEAFEDDYIYCLNTTGKKLFIGDYIFMDWDEIAKEDLFKYNCNSYIDLYDKYENGFHYNTMIQTSKRGAIPISKIEVGDILDNNTRVTGIVTIANNKPIFDYGSFKATQGLSAIQDLSSAATPLPTNHTPPFIYHILTNTGNFSINNQFIRDYNWNIDFLTHNSPKSTSACTI